MWIMLTGDGEAKTVKTKFENLQNSEFKKADYQCVQHISWWNKVWIIRQSKSNCIIISWT